MTFENIVEKDIAYYFFCYGVENIVLRVEIAGFENFLPFSWCFQKLSAAMVSNVESFSEKINPYCDEPYSFRISKQKISIENVYKLRYYHFPTCIQKNSAAADFKNI